MDHKKLEHMKETLLCAVETQMCDLGAVDTKELGEAIDMIKDLEEAIYYCTITKAMNEPQWQMEKSEDKHYYGYPMMYADSRAQSSDNRGGRNSNSRMNSYSDMNYTDMMRDYREGRSPMSRKMYMEARENHHDKTSQLRELEKYMQELTSDIVEMIQDASPEEKQYLEKKMTTLATKIGSMK